MKQFQTTVGSASVSEDFCRTFDLTTRIPSSTIEKALQDGRLITCDVLDIFDSIPSSGPIPAIHKIIARIEEILSQRSSKPNTPLRICIPGLGNHIWDELRSQDVLRFFHQLRSLLRRNPLACASISLDPRISTEAWGGPGWIQKLGWMCDGLITLDAFTTNPSLSSLFPSHHGMVYIHTLPSPHTLLSPSDRFSTLRGLSASVSEGGNSSGENNLAFKCTRKRLIFETMHLDVEGGVGERRITPAPVTNVIDNSARVTTVVPVSETSLASVKIEVELEPVAEVKAARISSETAFDNNGGSVVEEAQERKQRLKKPKKTPQLFSGNNCEFPKQNIQNTCFLIKKQVPYYQSHNGRCPMGSPAAASASADTNRPVFFFAVSFCLFFVVIFSIPFVYVWPGIQEIGWDDSVIPKTQNSSPSTRMKNNQITMPSLHGTLPIVFVLQRLRPSNRQGSSVIMFATETCINMKPHGHIFCSSI
ncbi:PAXNEB-domain-containing protein [Lentinula edodes]|uniref:Elongator complex protein 4 n=1 Tax=Lentinula edodes TaxID=5353 RepID=A0A1Q3EQ71_LENED|nr:PAXNEB-domain-containing protein [Lentinula edodes]